MNPAFHRFWQLHLGPQPLLLPNAWDARSAAILQAAGFRAIGTSSAAIASALGYADGEQTPFAELCYVVGRICAGTSLPVSVDLEGGYSREAEQIGRHVQAVVALGAAGINLEDSVSLGGRRELLAADAFADTLRAVRAFCHDAGLDVFFNIRTDTYLAELPDPLAATLERLRRYEAAGADGLFVPGLTDLADLRVICQATRLPVNVMSLPQLPDFAQLAAAGVRRISTGNFMHEALASRLQ